MIGYRPHSRRRFLAGAGACIALPFLHSALPRPLRAAPASRPPQRFIAYYAPCGFHMPEWTPHTAGPGYGLREILKPLSPLQDQVAVLTGLENRPAYPDGGTGGHASGTASFLTCAHARKTGGADIYNGISLDQQLASALGDHTVLRSLQLGVNAGFSAGICDSGYSCAYMANISWASPTSPLPKLSDPAVIFDLLFSFRGGAESEAVRAQRKRRGLSVLDAVTQEARALGERVGAEDHLKLEEYLNSVRELELRLQRRITQVQCDPGPVPPSAYTVEEHVQLLNELMVLAFRCDLTRFATLMLDNAASLRDYSFIGVNGMHHELSHHGQDPAKLTALTEIGRWEVQQLSHLLSRLMEVDEGGVPLLDNTLVLLSSEIEDGDTHAHTNLPVLLAGGGGGVAPRGEHRVFSGNPSIGQLFVAILQGFGLPDSRFGDDGDGPLRGL